MNPFRQSFCVLSQAFQKLLLTSFPGFEDEASPQRRDFYEDASYDDGYSPSPPRASGGAFFPPPPPAGGYHQTTTSTTHVNETYPPHPPYNPADYANSSTANDPYYPPRPRGREGDNVSSTKEASISRAVPYSPSHSENSEIGTPKPKIPQPQNTQPAVYPEGALFSLRSR